MDRELEEAFQDFNTILKKQKLLLEQKFQKLEEEKKNLQKLEEEKNLQKLEEKNLQKLEEQKKNLEKLCIKEGDVLSLNVGGEKFSVKRSTLTQIEGSLLASMFSGRWELERDNDGYIFLDLNPIWFKKIIDFLRCKRIETPDHPAPKPFISKDQESEFKLMVDYLGIMDLIIDQEVVDEFFDPNNKSDGITIFDNKTAINNAASKYEYVFGSTQISKGIWEWDLVIEKLDDLRPWVMIGVQVADIIDLNKKPYLTPGCYGWSTKKQVYTNGQFNNNGTITAVTGDTLQLKLDISSSKISLLNFRTNDCSEMTIPQKTWKLKICLFYPGNSIKILSLKQLDK